MHITFTRPDGEPFAINVDAVRGVRRNRDGTAYLVTGKGPFELWHRGVTVSDTFLSATRRLNGSCPSCGGYTERLGDVCPPCQEVAATVAETVGADLDAEAEQGALR